VHCDTDSPPKCQKPFTVWEDGGTFEQNLENISQAYERHFIHYKWYDAERAWYLTYLKCV